VRELEPVGLTHVSFYYCELCALLSSGVISHPIETQQFRVLGLCRWKWYKVCTWPAVCRWGYNCVSVHISARDAMHNPVC